MKNSSSNKPKPSAITPLKEPLERLQPRNEAEWMKNRAQIDRRAAAHTSGILIRCLGQLVDPRLWIRNYPVKSVGAAAVAGFFASGSLVRGKKEKSSKKSSKRSAAASPSLLTMLLMTGADILKSVGTSFLMQKIKSKGIKEASPHPPSPPRP